MLRVGNAPDNHQEADQGQVEEDGALCVEVGEHTKITVWTGR